MKVETLWDRSQVGLWLLGRTDISFASKAMGKSLMKTPMFYIIMIELSQYMFDLFIHLRARFSSEEGSGRSSHRRTRNTSRSTAISDSSARSAPSKVGYVVTPPGPCGTSWPLSSGNSQQDLPRQSFPGALWTRGRNNVAGISWFREEVRHSVLCEFHSCARSREVPHCKLLARIPSLSLRSKDQFTNW